jgi:beta-xylosidase
LGIRGKSGGWLVCWRLAGLKIGDQLFFLNWNMLTFRFNSNSLLYFSQHSIKNKLRSFTRKVPGSSFLSC